jgi:hypothetical protein
MSGRLQDAQAALDEARLARAEQDQAPLDLFGPPAELASVTEVIESVTSHTSNDWRDRALDAVRNAACTLDVLTVEDIAWPDDVEPYDDRARGGVMRQAARNGWLQSTKSYRPSERPETHCRPLLVWQSKLRGAA